MSKLIGVTVLSASLFVGLSGVNVVTAEAKNEVTKNNESKNELKISDFLNNNNRLSDSDTSNQSIVITDRDKISAIAKEQSLADPDSIKEIRFDSVLLNSEPSPSLSDIKPSVVESKIHIENVKDLGTGWIFKNNYTSHIFAGPASVEQTFSKTDSRAETGDLGLQFAKFVELKFSVSLGESNTESTKYSFTVPKGNTIELRVYTNYNKKSFEIWNLVQGALDYNLGTEHLNKAVGLYFEQIKR